MQSHARTLWYGEQPNAIAIQLNLCYLLKNKLKASNTLIIYQTKENSIFVSMPKTLAWTQQQVNSM
jgi:hypothetical protein